MKNLIPDWALMSVALEAVRPVKLEEIREARPLATVLPERVMARASLIATTFHIATPHDLLH